MNVKSWANYFIIIIKNLLNQLCFQTPSISTSMTVIHRKSLYHFYWEFCTPSQSSSECTFQSVAPVWQHISNEQFVFCFSFFPKITKHHTVTAVLWRLVAMCPWDNHPPALRENNELWRECQQPARPQRTGIKGPPAQPEARHPKQQNLFIYCIFYQLFYYHLNCSNKLHLVVQQPEPSKVVSSLGAEPPKVVQESGPCSWVRKEWAGR